MTGTASDDGEDQVLLATAAPGAVRSAEYAERGAVRP